MFNLKMGISLHMLSFDIDDKLIELVSKSKARTMELFARLFIEKPENRKARLCNGTVYDEKSESVIIRNFKGNAIVKLYF